jgi:alpha-1,3-fucosyltransferase
MTYRRDSDVVDLHPYGRIKCIHPSPSCLNFPRLNRSVVQEISSSVNFQIDLTLKNRAVAWFVSNCETDSRRELLARNLSRFIPVDIYGKCGDGRHSCQNRAGCDRLLSRHYRFYLSFENSLCPDYVTEKLYRPMAYDTVPVVYGGSDYSFYLPAGSYINAMDFDSPQSLANYLKKLMADDELYLSYFRWRQKFVVDPSPVDGLCRLCRLLSDTKTEAKFYPDISSWWAGNVTNRTCFPPPTSLV